MQDYEGLITFEIWIIFTAIKSRRITVTLIKGNPSQYVTLNIGGSLHYTTIGTLTKHDTMLRAMFSGRMEVLTDSEGKKNYEFAY